MVDRVIPVDELLDTPDGRDEIGVSDDQMERCSCGALFPRGESHRCGHVSERISWERYQDRQEASTA